MSEMLSGEVTRWKLCGVTRQYGVIQSMPFGRASALIRPALFNGATGEGQQREVVPPHARKIKNEMRAGTFTPTPICASLTEEQRKSLVIEGDRFTLNLSDEVAMLQTDGGHRFESLRMLADELAAEIEKTADAAEKAKLAEWLKEAQELPITVTIYFDGDPARDFVNLQQGKQVDATHLQSLAIAAKMVADPDRKTAHKLAHELHKHKDSPFKGYVRFDGRGTLPLPTSTLCAAGASDLSTSLVGLTKVGKLANKSNKFLVDAVVDAYGALTKLDEKMAHEGAVTILDVGKVLTPISEDGTKGSSTMLTGVGLCLAYRLISLGKDRADEEDLKNLRECALATLNRQTGGNFSGPLKRVTIGKFAKAFFADLKGPFHQGIPVDLLKALSTSTFSVDVLPKEFRSKPVRKPRTKKTASGKPATTKPKKTLPTLKQTPAAEPQPEAAPAPVVAETPAPTPVVQVESVQPEPPKVEEHPALAEANSATNSSTDPWDNLSIPPLT